MDNLLIGILLMTIGSFAGSSYYAPINKIKNWSWETYWICQGIVDHPAVGLHTLCRTFFRIGNGTDGRSC